MPQPTLGQPVIDTHSIDEMLDEAPLPEVQQAIEYLADALDVCQNRVRGLLNKMQPVLSDPAPSDAAAEQTAPDTPYSAQVAQVLFRLTTQVEQINGVLRDAESRCEV